MKRFVLLLPLLLTIYLSAVGKAPDKVIRTTTDRQIKAIERQVLRQYSIKVAITVISRNDKKEITNLKAVRYDKAGKQASSCSSDMFGALVITPDGCSIADLGYEKNIMDDRPLR